MARGTLRQPEIIRLFSGRIIWGTAKAAVAARLPRLQMQQRGLRCISATRAISAAGRIEGGG
eukprot:15476729-Alexandrium_andersonii.AAC.1